MHNAYGEHNTTLLSLSIKAAQGHDPELFYLKLSFGCNFSFYTNVVILYYLHKTTLLWLCWFLFNFWKFCLLSTYYENMSPKIKLKNKFALKISLLNNVYFLSSVSLCKHNTLPSGVISSCLQSPIQYGDIAIVLRKKSEHFDISTITGLRSLIHINDQEALYPITCLSMVFLTITHQAY